MKLYDDDDDNDGCDDDDYNLGCDDDDGKIMIVMVMMIMMNILMIMAMVMHGDINNEHIIVDDNTG